MNDQAIKVPGNKKLYFASDFHLGSPNQEISLEREKKIVRWLNVAKNDAQVIYILGDIFDFWFEYKNTIPKGYSRLLGTLADIRDAEIEIVFFTGNHDMWMFDYFPKEFGIPVHRKPITLTINNFKFMIGHGDGLGPGDRKYKILKNIFENKISQWMFRWIHPDLGIPVANLFSKNSRDKNLKKDIEFHGEKEWLIQYCKSVEEKNHHDFYIFGHRHFPLDTRLNETSRYINLGDWLNNFTYAVWKENVLTLEKFED